MNYRAELWLVVPLAGLVLLLVPPVAMLAVVAAALALVAAAVALVGAVLALPYLLTRSLHRRWRAQRGSMQAPEAIVASHPHARIVGRDMAVADPFLADELPR